MTETVTPIEVQCRQTRDDLKNAIDGLPNPNPSLPYGVDRAVLTTEATHDVNQFLHNGFLPYDTQLGHVRISHKHRQYISGPRSEIELWLFYSFPELRRIPEEDRSRELESFVRLDLGNPSWKSPGSPRFNQEQICMAGPAGPSTRRMLHNIDRGLADAIEAKHIAIGQVFNVGQPEDDRRLLPIFRQVLGHLQAGRAERAYDLPVK